MKLINKEQISHLTVFKETEGVHSFWNGYLKHVWMETDYFKFLWLFKTSWVNYEKGFYRNFKRSWMSNNTPFKINEKQHFVKNNSVWTYSFIYIFSAGKEIHKEYFKTYKELEKHIKENYNNCTIKYE